MNYYWCEIDYISMSGEPVHSDITIEVDEGCPQPNKREMLVFMAEIIELADWNKPWSLVCHGLQQR